MSYQQAMESAGAEVHVFESFGSYQGDWWAKVTYKGQTGWINGSFGSCSVCDAFQSEFSCDWHECESDEYFSPITNGDFREGCSTCQDLKERLVKFGEKYLDGIMTQEEAIKEASKNIEWDLDAQGMIDFLKANK